MKRIKSYEHQHICYFIATPIGNLEDFSSRGLKILNEVDIIACEDTRTTQNLLSHFNIKKSLVSYHEHNEHESGENLIKKIKEGKKVAVVSDAGYPGISDPGSIMIKLCIENDIAVSIIPGANAFLPALIGSSLNTERFYFHGFLPSKPSARRKELEDLIDIPVTIIFYESPHRIIETLNDMFTCLGDRQITLVREITKLHEEYIYSSLEEIKDIDKNSLKGEMVLIVEGKKETINYDDSYLLKLLNEEIEKGFSLKEASNNVSLKTKIKKNYLYKLGLNK